MNNKTKINIFHSQCRLGCLVPIIIIALFGCQKDAINMKAPDSGFYKGTIDVDNVELIQDSVFLNISDGNYECSTELPYNYGAGMLIASESQLNFIDTLFFPIPALYITGFALSGRYHYQYDGANLTIEKLSNHGKLIYRLKKVK